MIFAIIFFEHNINANTSVDLNFSSREFAGFQLVN